MARAYRVITIVVGGVPFTEEHTKEDSISEIIDYSFAYHELYGHDIEKIQIEEIN